MSVLCLMTGPAESLLRQIFRHLTQTKSAVKLFLKSENTCWHRQHMEKNMFRSLRWIPVWLSLVSVSACAAREKAPEHGQTSISQQSCCLVKVDNQLSVPVELHYTSFAIHQNANPQENWHREGISQSAGLSFKHETLQAGESEKIRVQAGSEVRLRYQLPAQDVVTEHKVRITDLTLLRLRAEGLENLPLPEAERPLISF
jgi:hypothetical protein